MLMCAWQLWEDRAQCVGLEVQEDRFRRAVRSVECNLGTNQDRVIVFHRDLRSITTEERELGGLTFDAITGTPPYFDGGLKGQPGEKSAAGCIFELHGGVEEYCAAVGRVMRRPSQRETPCFFTVCQTALSSDRVYRSCEEQGMTILRRVDVIPKENRDVLFCVFTMTLHEWIRYYRPLSSLLSGSSSKVDILESNDSEELDKRSGKLVNGRAIGSITGELVETLTVRKADLSHTEVYADILASLGKPSSRDKDRKGEEPISSG